MLLPRHPSRLPIRTLWLALAAAALPGQGKLDTSDLRQRAAAATTAVGKALQQGQQAVRAARTAVGDPANKVQGDLDQIDNSLLGESFDAAIGTLRITFDHLEFVAEERRAATREALLTIDAALAQGSLAVLQLQALQELATRGEALAGLGPDDDATAVIVDLAASVALAARSKALPQAELAQLQHFLASRRAAAGERTAAEQLALARANLAELERQFQEMRQEMASELSSDRDRGFARFDDAAQQIRMALAKVPQAARLDAAASLAKLTTEADALYAKANAAATLARIRENWLFTADSFDGWQDEAPNVTTAGYLDFEPANVDVFAAPRTVALVGRANAWLAFVGQDLDYRRNQRAPEVAEFTDSILAMRKAAIEKLAKVATTIVADMAAVELGDERLRGRLQTFADWDLPLALQNHAVQRPLVDRVHALLDSHARTLLGEGAAAAIAEMAMAAAEALWSRSQQWLPVEAGFEPSQAELFVGRLMRFDTVWPRTSEFAAGTADLLFDLQGHVFAAQFTPELAAALRHERRRLLPDAGAAIAEGEPLELMAVVGQEASAQLLGDRGAENAIAVPTRILHVVGVRQGPVFAIQP